MLKMEIAAKVIIGVFSIDMIMEIPFCVCTEYSNRSWELLYNNFEQVNCTHSSQCSCIIWLLMVWVWKVTVAW